MGPALAIPEPSPPTGDFLTSIESDRTVIWLVGEIDLVLADDLAEISENVHNVGSRVVLDVSGMTFCDTTLVHFTEDIAQHAAVTVVRPPRLLIHLLELCGLADRVQIASFPGVAAALGLDAGASRRRNRAPADLPAARGAPIVTGDRVR